MILKGVNKRREREDESNRINFSLSTFHERTYIPDP